MHQNFMLTRNNLSVRASEASSKHRSSEIDSPDKTLIRESWKIQIAGPSLSAFRGENPKRSVASFVYVAVLRIYPEIALGDGLKYGI